MKKNEMRICRVVMELGSKFCAKKMTIDGWKLLASPARVSGMMETKDSSRKFIVFFKRNHGWFTPFLAIVNPEEHSRSYFLDSKGRWTT